jgi:hypothetical protein
MIDIMISTMMRNILYGFDGQSPYGGGITWSIGCFTIFISAAQQDDRLYDPEPATSQETRRGSWEQRKPESQLCGDWHWDDDPGRYKHQQSDVPERKCEWEQAPLTAGQSAIGTGYRGYGHRVSGK